MRKLATLFFVFALLASCADEQSTDTKTYKGNFLLFEDNAVLEVNEVMYTVKNDAMTQELATKAANWQKTPFDMVPVTLEAVVEAKPANTEGWDSILTIKRIVEVSPTSVGPDIEIEETNQ
ncbi:hypothetical protein [Gilvibacter sediminis]|uniref:hypothetical protein n=1 Tax=Gilvibacter sediminis TaxID=379071 RepID=UPI0023500DE5|nr:hypothetical protein [Gilvibacter sediminis]MDC7997080.1 hypothetical protein [Gilvibacter sediminis]